MDFTEAVGFIFYEDKRFLMEKRKQTKQIDPGLIIIPGGHIEQDETPEDALLREITEELAVTATEYRFACTLLHRSNNQLLRIHYYLITGWKGEMKANEAESILWKRRDEIQELPLEIDRVAIRECERIYLQER